MGKPYMLYGKIVSSERGLTRPLYISYMSGIHSVNRICPNI